MTDAHTETGRLGRVATVRLRPNQDLVEGIERACTELGFRHGMVRTAVGSLVDATMAYGEGDALQQGSMTGPGVEILTLMGEVRPDADGRPVAELRGMVGDPSMRVLGGRFVRGANPICITLELVLQEWIPEDANHAPA